MALRSTSDHLCIQVMDTWNDSPYKRYGLLLRCEVLGEGYRINNTSELASSRVHVVKDFESIMPRYLLLIPPDLGEDYIPSRETVTPRMLSTFRKIEAGLDASYYEGPKFSEKKVLDAQHFSVVNFMRWIVYKLAIAV